MPFMLICCTFPSKHLLQISTVASYRDDLRSRAALNRLIFEEAERSTVVSIRSKTRCRLKDRLTGLVSEVDQQSTDDTGVDLASV